jgi:hypothetical protein
VGEGWPAAIKAQRASVGRWFREGKRRGGGLNAPACIEGGSWKWRGGAGDGMALLRGGAGRPWPGDGGGQRLG